VDWGTTTNILLSGSQFVEGRQLVPGELVLVMGQTDSSKNGIYKVGSGVWALQGFDNENHRYIDASTIDTSWSGGVLTYGQLGVYLGAVNVARGVNAARLFQIYFENPSVPVSVGTKVFIGPVNPSSVNRIDFFTGIYMAGGETRVTQDDFVRTTQQVGQASGNLNEIPGWSNLVPGSCKEDIGKPTNAPYGCATRQGLPSSMTSLPFAGPLWPTLQNQSIQVWLNNQAIGSHWTNNFDVQVTFNNSFWPDPGPGASFAPISFRADMRNWLNVQQLVALWANALNAPIDWTNGVRTGNFPPGGDILWTNDKCNLVLWHNLGGNQVDFAEIYPNLIKPNKSAPWPWGWM
jgi:hypothetical protein